MLFKVAEPTLYKMKNAIVSVRGELSRTMTET